MQELSLKFLESLFLVIIPRDDFFTLPKCFFNILDCTY